MSSVVHFGPPSLQAQLAELQRERKMRVRVYDYAVLRGKMTDEEARHHNRGLDGAIATLERLVREQSEPTRGDVVELLRLALDSVPPGSPLHRRISESLRRIAQAAGGELDR